MPTHGDILKDSLEVRFGHVVQEFSVQCFIEVFDENDLIESIVTDIDGVLASSECRRVVIVNCCCRWNETLGLCVERRKIASLVRASRYCARDAHTFTIDTLNLLTVESLCLSSMDGSAMLVWRIVWLHLF